MPTYIATFSPAPRACPSGTGDVDKVGTNSSQIDPLHIGAKVPFLLTSNEIWILAFF